MDLSDARYPGISSTELETEMAKGLPGWNLDTAIQKVNIQLTLLK